MEMETYRRGALVKDGIDRVVEEQASHCQALLFAAAQGLIPVLHLVPSLSPERRQNTASPLKATCRPICSRGNEQDATKIVAITKSRARFSYEEVQPHHCGLPTSPHSKATPTIDPSAHVVHSPKKASGY